MGLGCMMAWVMIFCDDDMINWIGEMWEMSKPTGESTWILRHFSFLFLIRTDIFIGCTTSSLIFWIFRFKTLNGPKVTISSSLMTLILTLDGLIKPYHYKKTPLKLSNRVRMSCFSITFLETIIVPNHRKMDSLPCE